MKILQGIPASPGYAVGRAIIYRQPTLSSVAGRSIASDETKEHRARLLEAFARSIEELEAVKEQVLSELGEAEAYIFDAHLSLLQDEGFRDRITTRINEDLVSVEQALAAEVANLERLMSALENEYLRERSLDFRDIGNRVLRNLRGERTNPLSELPPDSIVVASMLTPSDTVALNQANVVGLATEVGGDTSHAAILARSLEIPAVTGLASLLDAVKQGNRLLIDGKRGILTCNPTRRQEARLQRQQVSFREELRRAREAEQKECRTSDGTRIHLYANINRAHEAPAVAGHNMDGVGLFRTEFLYLKAKSAPRLDSQLRVYRRTAEAVAPKPLTVRTFDVGGDKRPEFITHHHEANSYLRLRGLRFALKEKHLLRTQLRAILRAHQECGNLRILFPMVVSYECICRARELLAHVQDQEGVKSLPPVGAMLETPAAIFELPEIIEQVDFISVGTNDLGQYMFAADRTSLEKVSAHTVMTPAMLRALKQVADVCRAGKCEVAVCGEAAGAVPVTALLLGLGFRHLSITPARAAAVHYGLQQLKLKTAQNLAKEALKLHQEADVVTLVRQRLPRALLNLGAKLEV